MPRNSIRMLSVLGVPLPTRMTMVVRLSFGGGTSVIRIRRILPDRRVMFIKILYAIFPIGRGNLPISPNPNLRLRTLCVKTRQPFALNEKNGFRSATIVNMGAVALRLNRTLNFDPVKLEFIDDEAANRLLDQPMRAPWNI